MTIWVDADACPVAIKEILYRAAERTATHTMFVANRLLRLPPSAYLQALQVPQGFDAADARISELLQAGDLVITGDIPLAAIVIGQGAHVISPRGEPLTTANIQERLSMRNWMEELRSSGVELSGPSPLNNSDRQAFAAALDKFLQQQKSAR